MKRLRLTSGPCGFLPEPELSGWHSSLTYILPSASLSPISYHIHIIDNASLSKGHILPSCEGMLSHKVDLATLMSVLSGQSIVNNIRQLWRGAGEQGVNVGKL